MWPPWCSDTISYCKSTVVGLIHTPGKLIVSISRKLNKKWGTDFFSTRFSLLTFLLAGESDNEYIKIIPNINIHA